MSFVFFRTQEGGKPADEFIPKQDAGFQSSLRSAADELSQTGVISRSDASRQTDGAWSLYLKDKAGDMHRLQLYISSLDTAAARLTHGQSPSTRRLVICVPNPYDGRPGETLEMDASEYIKKTFRGDVREKLLAALDRAMDSLPHYDGSVEFTSSGVILRAPSKGHSIARYDAEVTFYWS